MNKLAKLLQLAESFYQTTLSSLAQAQSFTMPDDPDEGISSSTGGDLTSEADKYDIKDEELFNQFEAFMSAYKELMDSLNVNPSNLTEDAMEESAQLIDVLNTRYVRIMNNSYLNLKSDEGYDEDFDPGEFTSFIQKVVKDAENKLKTIAGSDLYIGEMRSVQYAQEFNQQMIDRGDKNITFTGDKVQQLLEARRNWFKNLMFIKKVGKSHPEYERFQRYISGRHKEYQNIISDPERKQAYRSKAKERQTKYRKKLDLRKKEILSLLKTTKDPKKLEELQIELSTIDRQLEQRKTKGQEIASKVREVKQSGSLTGLIVHLQQRIATQRNEVAKAIKTKAAKDPYFDSFKQAVKNAKERMDKEPSPANQNLLEEAIRAEAAAIKNYLDNHHLVKQVKQDLSLLYDFRDKVKSLNEMVANHETAAAISNEAKPIIQQLIAEGETLISTFERVYRSPIATIREILQLLRTKL